MTLKSRRQLRTASGRRVRRPGAAPARKCGAMACRCRSRVPRRHRRQPCRWRVSTREGSANQALETRRAAEQHLGCSEAQTRALAIRRLDGLDGLP